MYVLKRATRKDETAFDIGRDRVRVPARRGCRRRGWPAGVGRGRSAAWRAAANKAAALARRAALENQGSPAPAPPPPPRPSSPRVLHLRARGVGAPPWRGGGKNRRAARFRRRSRPVRRLNFLPSRDAGTFVLLWCSRAAARRNESLGLPRREPSRRASLWSPRSPGRARSRGQRTSPRVHVRRAVRDAFNPETQRNIQLLGFVGDPGEVISRRPRAPRRWWSTADTPASRAKRRARPRGVRGVGWRARWSRPCTPRTGAYTGWRRPHDAPRGSGRG